MSQLPPQPKQAPQTAQETVASEAPLTRNRFSATRDLYVLALLIGLALMLPDGALVESSLPALLTWFPLVAVLIATAYRVWRSFRPGGELITPGRALIAAGLVPTGALLVTVGYMMVPDASKWSLTNDWDGFLALLFVVFVLVPLIVSLLGAGLVIRKKERNAESSR